MTATRLSPASPTVTQISLPADARALSTLAADRLRGRFHGHGSGRAQVLGSGLWAVIDDAPSRVRARLYMGWLGLGLKLGPPWSSHRVLGWRVARTSPTGCSSEASSWLGLRGELLFRREPDGLLFATLIQHRRPPVPCGSVSNRVPSRGPRQRYPNAGHVDPVSKPGVVAKPRCSAAQPRPCEVARRGILSDDACGAGRGPPSATRQAVRPTLESVVE